MTKKKVQRRPSGAIRVYKSGSHDYVDYASYSLYKNSQDYSNETVHDVSNFEGFSDQSGDSFGGGSFGGGGAGGSWGHNHSNDDSPSFDSSFSDSGGGDCGGD